MGAKERGQSQHADVTECFPGQAPLIFLKAAGGPRVDKEGEGQSSKGTRISLANEWMAMWSWGIWG